MKHPCQMSVDEWLQWLTHCKESGMLGPISGKPQADRDTEYEKAWQLAVKASQA